MVDDAQKSEGSRKVACRSRQAVNLKIKNLYDCLDKTLKKNDTRTPADRNRYIQKFKEVYERIIQQNITVKGENCEPEKSNTTPEYEPLDKQKQMCISEELLPLLDDCVVKIAKKRKRLPHACLKAVTNFSNHQAAYMSKVKPKAKEEDLSTVASDCKDATCFLDSQHLCQPYAALSCLTKTAPKERERAAQLDKAMEMEAANRSDTLTENAVNSKKRKLESAVFHTTVTHSKYTRLSTLPARDFVVQPGTI